ncbi:isoprenylcysteine carboxyl methyltransferase [Trichococcus palustris]|jgi:protein-S-isoprenylcysteine O-methyltransferase Ste14|uniref:Isoprenylcysteine carboxyl methyltransferase n=1 Tax=Trichococcus palustris TaxID=140314 RepID=A0A143YGL8_9LACT|nr:isoprenylcysteine carboxylmethyltransferase family protein [Trichococcus palustris]CZQ86486.1 isoprenylcysteine carboxyl methyltransferase [Trichococcus palustris]SFK58775.1 Protein-S-isoprenylcysteine O-methyltransferase Ste14 [Trichococcus palustris]
MGDELIFRIFFWVLLLMILIFNRIIPAIKAKKSGTKLWLDKEAIKNEGNTLVMLRIISGIILCLFVSIYSFYPSLSDRFQFYLPIWLRWLGTVIATVGVLFWIYAQSVLDRNWSGNLKIQKGHKLMTTGPYGRIRHPIYAAMLLWSVGLALFTAHTFFVLLLIIVIIFMSSRVPKEEKIMIEHFGEEYKKYMKKTGRYLPKMNHPK